MVQPTAQTGDAKPWGQISADERVPILAAIRQVIEEEKAGDKVKVNSLDQFVLPLAAGEMQYQCRLSVEGKFPEEQAEMADALKAKLMVAGSKVKGFACNIGCPKGIGSKMGVIKDVIDCRGGETDGQKVEIVHNQGEVILLDFWASWCPPCQKPMQHNQDMLAKREDWKGKVRIIGNSIDQDENKLRNHIKAKGWTSVEHYRNADSTGSDEFGAEGVPHVALIDTEGKIVFIGHPASRPNLEADIDALSKGEKITGKGTVAEAPQSSEEEGGANKEISHEEFKTLSEKFLDCCKAANNEEVKTVAKGFQRAFFVLVVDQKMDNASGKMMGEMQCICQILGGTNKEAAEKMYATHLMKTHETEGWEKVKMIQ